MSEWVGSEAGRQAADTRIPKHRVMKEDQDGVEGLDQGQAMSSKAKARARRAWERCGVCGCTVACELERHSLAIRPRGATELISLNSTAYNGSLALPSCAR